MAPDSPRFDVRLEGRSARLSLARPLESTFVRVSKLDVALEPFAGRVDLRGGALAFRHRRSTAIEAELDVDLVAVLDAVSAAGVRVAVERADSGRLDLRVEDGTSATNRRVELSTDGVDLRLRAPDGADVGTWLATWPLAYAVEREASDLRVRDPIGWAMREALLPHGFRAPRVAGGALAFHLVGRRLRLSLRTESA